jgi:hypothetical protein
MNEPEHLTETRRWLRFASEDIKAAETLLKEGGGKPRHVCWLAQQAAEKYIKVGDCSKATGKIRGNDCWTSAHGSQSQRCRALWAGPQSGRRALAPVVRRNLLAPNRLRRSCPASVLQSLNLRPRWHVGRDVREIGPWAVWG